MPRPSEVEKAARDMEAAWKVVENGERLPPAKRALLREGVKKGISFLKEWAETARQRQGAAK